MIKLKPHKILDSEKLYTGLIFDLYRHNVELPSGKKVNRDVVKHNGATVIVPVTDDGQIVMVRQYRYGSEGFLLELPAGKLDPNENPQECALRELEEETGYRATKIKPLLGMFPVAAYCTEKITMFLAEGLIKGTPKPDDDEFVEVELYPLTDLVAMITNGEIADMKTIAGVLYYFLYSSSNGYQ